MEILAISCFSITIICLLGIIFIVADDGISKILDFVENIIRIFTKEKDDNG